MRHVKFILLLAVFTIFLSGSRVYAKSDSFYEGEAVTGAYLKKFKPGATTGKYEQMRIFRRSSDHQAAYCIEIWETLASNQAMVGYEDNYLLHTNLTEDVWERIQLISYYGYEYKNHTTDNWYAASQYLIWKAIEPNSTIYFTDTLNGNQVSKFEAEITEIESLISRHYVLPSFAGQKFVVNPWIENYLVDENGVLSDYEVTSDFTSVSYRKNESTLHFKIDKDLIKVKFRLTKEDTTRKTSLYISPNGQDLIVRGNYPKIMTDVDVEVGMGNVVFQKVDKDTGESNPQGEASFTGTTYELYDQNYQLVTTFEFEDDDFVFSTVLPYGTYYVREIKSGPGYQVDPTEYTVAVGDKTVVFVLPDKVYEGTVKIQKFYEIGSILKEEENASFEVYNSKDELVGTYTTDKLGKIEVTFPYGTYRFHQVGGRENYNFIDDFSVTIDDRENQEYQFTFKNTPIHRYVKVIKKDAETKKEIVIGNASFRIKNLDTGDYVRQKLSYPNGEIVDIFQTSNHGFFMMPEALPAGNYQLEEVESPDGYYKLEKPILFQITEDSPTIDIPGYGLTILLEVENVPKTGTVAIQKLGEVFEFLDEQIHYEYQPLENIMFSIYAEEDIISGDGSILYSKGELIEEAKTNSEGKIIFSLPIGKYSVIEKTFLEGYLQNEKTYDVEITSDDLEETLIVYNYLKKGSLVIHKKDASTGEAIKDTYFSVFTKDGKLVATIVTDENGIAVLNSIPLGEYYLEETKSNFNYIKDSIKKTFTINETGEIITLDLLNEPILPPKTSVDEGEVKTVLCGELFFEIVFGFVIVCLKPYFHSKKMD